MEEAWKALKRLQRSMSQLSEEEVRQFERAALGCDEQRRYFVDEKTDNTPWRIRECRGHYHITSGPPEWLDLALPGDPFQTKEDAQVALQTLSEPITKRTTTE